MFQHLSTSTWLSSYLRTSPLMANKLRNITSKFSYGLHGLDDSTCAMVSTSSCFAWFLFLMTLRVECKHIKTSWLFGFQFSTVFLMFAVELSYTVPIFIRLNPLNRHSFSYVQNILQSGKGSNLNFDHHLRFRPSYSIFSLTGFVQSLSIQWSTAFTIFAIELSYYHTYVTYQSLV